jgi:hypothetical protein
MEQSKKKKKKEALAANEKKAQLVLAHLGSSELRVDPINQLG